MKRYKTINFVDELEKEEIEVPEQIVGDYVVDDSNFVPTSEAIRQLGAGGVTKDIQNQYYDFPTGEDTGVPVPFSRRPECNDIAVLSSRISEDTEAMSEQIKESKKARARADKLEADIKAAAASSSSPAKSE